MDGGGAAGGTGGGGGGGEALYWHNQALAEGQWERQVLWSGANDALAGTEEEASEACVNLNDPRLVFELTSKSKRAAALPAQAASLILPASYTAASRRLQNQRREGVKPVFRRFNLSKDEFYQKKVQRKMKEGVALPVKHAVPALTMATAGLTDLQPERYFLDFHRPRGRFAPAPGAADHAGSSKRDGGKVNLIMKNLNGASAVMRDWDAEQKRVRDIWPGAVAKLKSKFGDFEGHESPRLLHVGPSGELVPLVNPDQTLRAAGFRGEEVIWVVPSSVNPALSAVTQRLPPDTGEVPVRPPGAFKRLKDLTMGDGHVFLLEYFEENPLVLSNPGMGTRLVTFYRKKSADDKGWRDLEAVVQATHRSTLFPPWGRLGQVVTLNEKDDPPFLASIEPGKHQFAVENNLFRAPAAHHPPAAKDFLLLRLPSGRWELREASGVISVGQQEPNIRIPVPLSVPMRLFEEKRFCDFVLRELRRRHNRHDKAVKAGLPQPPTALTISVNELRQRFPNNSEQLIRNRLREKCGCEPKVAKGMGANEGRWGLRADSRIPEEAELRARLTPEELCAYESMRTSEIRLRARGVTRFEKLMGQSTERMKLSIHLVPGAELHDRTVGLSKKVATFIHNMLRISSWNLSQCYAEVVKEGRGTFALSGVGDPSGRGRGISYIKAAMKEGTKDEDEEAEKRANEAKVKAKRGKNMIMPASGTIAGTAADLRRLSMEQARQMLLKLGATDAEIRPLTRWNRIAFLKSLAGAAAKDGGELGNMFGRFGRNNKQTVSEQQMLYQGRCKEIVGRQLAALETEWEDDGIAPTPVAPPRRTGSIRIKPLEVPAPVADAGPAGGGFAPGTEAPPAGGAADPQGVPAAASARDGGAAPDAQQGQQEAAGGQQAAEVEQDAEEKALDDDLENALEEFLQDSDDDEGGEVDADEDAEELRKLQEEGIGGQKNTAGDVGGKSGEAAKEEAPKKKKKKKKKKGQKDEQPRRRLRRIFTKTHADGSVTTREVVFTDMGMIEALRMLRASQIAEAQAAAGIRPSANGRDLMTARERRRLQERHRRLKKNLANRERELTKLRKEQGGGKAGPSGASAAAGPAAPKINVKLSQSKGPSLKVKPVAKRAADSDLGGAPAKKQKQGGGSERAPARAPVRSDIPRGGPALNRILRRGHVRLMRWPGAAAFLKSMDASKVLDYRLYVRHAISLEDIDFALVTSSYSSWEEYVEALERIAENARAYHTAERAMFREPRLVEAAERVLARAKQELCLAIPDLEGLRKGSEDTKLRALRDEVSKEQPPSDAGGGAAPAPPSGEGSKPLPKLVVKAPKLVVKAPKLVVKAPKLVVKAPDPAPAAETPQAPPAAPAAKSLPKLVVRVPGGPGGAPPPPAGQQQ